MANTSFTPFYEPDELFSRARAGDPRAWEQLFVECSPKLLRVIRRELSQPMRSLYDSSDFVNDVFKSLVAKSNSFDFPTLDDLKSFLIKAAKQKICDEYRRQHTLKRDVKRNRRLGSADIDDAGYDPPALDPTPSQFAAAHEIRDQLLAGSTGVDREVIELKSQDYSNVEVAECTGLNLRTVQRILKRIVDNRMIRT